MEKEIKGFENYIIDTEGNVFSKHSNRYLIPTLTQDGYQRVKLCFGNGKYINKTIHRIVAETFLLNPNNLPQVNHKDENKLNNSVDNLEWCTIQYNNTYGSRIAKARKKKINHTNLSKKVAKIDVESNDILVENMALNKI